MLQDTMIEPNDSKKQDKTIDTFVDEELSSIED